MQIREERMGYHLKFVSDFYDHPLFLNQFLKTATVFCLKIPSESPGVERQQSDNSSEGERMYFHMSQLHRNEKAQKQRTAEHEKNW
jgi:hypothetical protein